MQRSITARPLTTGALSFTVATAMTSVAAMAACGGAPTLVALSGLVGPPSITATETSTDQALELIRKRREEASGSCPAGFVRSGGNCVPAGQASTPAAQPAAASAQQVAAAPAPQVTTTTTTGPAPASQAAAPRPKQAAGAPAAASTTARPVPRRAPAQQQVAAAQPAPEPTYGSSRGGSIKDGGYDIPMAGTVRTTGVWVEGYYDYERHKNLNPGGGAQNNPTRRMVSGGVVAGADISQYSLGSQVQGHQFGVFSGYNSTRSKITDTVGNKFQPTLNSTQLTASSDQRQETEGAFLGLYGSMVHGGFSADLAFKVDFFDYETSSRDTLLTPCNQTFLLRANTSMTNYVVASNANYRIPLSSNHYIEPTVGLRYTITDFGSNAAAASVRDGEAFRVQGGVRLGTRFLTPDGWVWNMALTGLLYSDVSINGYRPTTVDFTAPPFPIVDEGKLRAMGILETRVDVGRGYTLYGDVEVRGGQDVYGFGSRLGVRYQW